MSVSEINTYMSDAAAAVASEDYATARNKARAAMALMSVLPNSAKDGQSLAWDRAAIKAFIDEMDKAIDQAAEGANSASGGISFGKIGWQSVDGQEDCC